MVTRSLKECLCVLCSEPFATKLPVFFMIVSVCDYWVQFCLKCWAYVFCDHGCREGLILNHHRIVNF